MNSAYDDSTRSIRTTVVGGSSSSGGGVGAIYVSTATTYNSGASTSLYTDVNGNLKTREQYAPGYEDNVNNKAIVEHRYSYSNVTVADTTTTHRSTAGFIHTIVVGSISCPSVVFYDATTATAPNFFSLGPNAPMGTYILDTSLATGLTTKVSAGAAPSILISSR